MAHLGTLRGSGILEWDDKRVPVTYHLHITASGGAIGGSGSLGHDVSLYEAFNANKQTLRLADGETVSILINHMGSDGTRFLTSGRIPGGWEKMVGRYA